MGVGIGVGVGVSSREGVSSRASSREDLWSMNSGMSSGSASFDDSLDINMWGAGFNRNRNRSCSQNIGAEGSWF